ncbi:MAG: phosphoglucosamine mutase [Bacteroidetes bacterium]|uniref:Phosphoglucosamine mutase n=1 Tax=Candidatus Cryptobacteroides gallistercoris TaxID=2840765 RepID=A0A940IGU9_9BACT|nr:phosphoglucosamine mutase [Candidatus Cryptobacteroides gallistercoris]
MTLIKSISGIRGTIGGAPGDALTPVDIVKFTYAYCVKLRERLRKPQGERYKVVVGKDARISGEMVEQMVCGTLLACGVDVVKAGFASTPTTEMAVIFEKADGGIILTASHNPKQWNALKLLNEKGEFLNAEEGAGILACAEEDNFDFADVDSIGSIEEKDFTDMHIDAVLALDAVDADAIRKAGFKVALDAVNSVGGIIMPRLFKRLGVECVEVNCTPDGHFAHNPEPLPANLTDLCRAVVDNKADLGVSVDPDVDRLALICEDGKPFGEEYTLVSVADYLLSRAESEAKAAGKPVEEVIAPYRLTTASNLSSSRALRDVTEAHGGKYYAAAVGEVNVTTKMKECGALIGGEGNGGVIYPALHYGRDAIVGTALFLTNLAHRKCTVSELLATYPKYHITKNRIDLSDKALIDKILDEMKKIYASEDINDIDGVKISFESRKEWVHLRKSNTEPIIRIYAEAATQEAAEKLAGEIKAIAGKIIS